MAEEPKLSVLRFVGTVPKLTTDGARKPYRAFVIDVSLDSGATYQLSHLRFSDFAELDDVLKSMFPLAHQALPAFPRKTLGKPTEEQWLDRLRALELYFTGVLAMPALAQNPTFIKLFQKPPAETGGMRAAIYHSYGAPSEVLRVVNTLPKPAMPLKPHDVFIEVFASSVNPTDVRLMEGASDLLEFIGVVAFPFTPGMDVCGIVRGIGAEVTTFSVGDAVVADTGVTVCGGLAEFATAADSNCARKPKNMSFVEASAFPRSGLVAYQTLVHDLKVGVDGDKKQVLILGGHTGTGSIAIQIAKYFGCNVTVTVQGDASDWAKRLGADTVSTSSQWWEDFKGQGFDAVFDTVGEDEGFEHSKAVLKDKGAFATELPEYLRKAGNGIGAWVKQGAVTAGRKIASVASVGYHNAWATVKQEDLEALRLLIEGGDFKSVANHYFPLAEAVKAFELVRSGASIGKVVVTIKEDNDGEVEREFAAAKASMPSISLPTSSPAKRSDNDNNNNNISAVSNNNNNTSVDASPVAPASGAGSGSTPSVVRNLAASEYSDEEASKGNPFS